MSNLLKEQPLVATPLGHPLPIITIMVVDDDIDDSEMTKSAILELSPKYRVVCMNKSSDVLAHLDALNYTELPSLLVLDYNMPIYSGLQLLQILKSKSRYRHIPVVIYSNSVYPKHKEECLQAGACMYLVKSPTIHALHEDVKQLLGHCL